MGHGLDHCNLQEAFRLGDIGPDPGKEFDRLHFGIFRAGEQPLGKKGAERMVNRLGIMGFLSTKLTSSICMLVGWFIFWGALRSDGRREIFQVSWQYVGWGTAALLPNSGGWRK